MVQKGSENMPVSGGLKLSRVCFEEFENCGLAPPFWGTLCTSPTYMQDPLISGNYSFVCQYPAMGFFRN